MAFATPQASSPQNNPSHSLLHRILDIDTSAAEQSVVIDASGNVGIGTTNPSKKLEIAGDTLINTTNSSQPFKLSQATYLNFSIDYPSSPSIYTTQINFGLLGRLQYDGNGGVMNIENRSSQAGSSMGFVMGTTERLRITDTGNVGIGTTTPTAVLHLKAGTASANTAPIKFTAGINLTTPEAGVIEFDGTDFYFTV